MRTPLFFSAITGLTMALLLAVSSPTLVMAGVPAPATNAQPADLSNQRPASPTEPAVRGPRCASRHAADAPAGDSSSAACRFRPSPERESLSASVISQPKVPFEDISDHSYLTRNKDNGVIQGKKSSKPKISAASATPLFQVVKQFEETSYYLKDVCFKNADIGWAVGEPHWDQTQKRYTGTIVKTTDGGKTWTPQKAGVTATLRGVSFVDINNGWVVGENGTILNTNDGGNHWTKQQVTTTDEFRGVVFTDTNHGWATSIRVVHYDSWGDPDDWRGSIWHTNNGGLSWIKQTVPDNTSILNRIDFVDSNKGWAVGIKYIGYGGVPQHLAVVYHTSDGGNTWQEQYDPNLEIVFTGVDFVDANHGWVVGFAMNSGVEGGKVFRTSDGGVHWTRLDVAEYFWDTLWDVHFLDQNRGYFVGFNYATGDQPLYRTLNGGTSWQDFDKFHAHGGLFAVAVTETRAWVVGDYDYVGSSLDPWGPCEGLECRGFFTGKYVSIHYEFEDAFFVDTNHGWVVGRRSFGQPYCWGKIILHTKNSGITWETQYELAPTCATSKDQTDTSYASLYGIYAIDSQNSWAVGSTQQDNDGPHGAILHTTDGGSHWEEQGSELYEYNLLFDAVRFINSQNGWALGDKSYDGNIFLAHTTDGGTRWEWIDTGIKKWSSAGGRGLDFTDAQNGWVARYGTVIYTNDGGVTWVDQLHDSWIATVDFINNQKGWGVAGLSLYYTTNGGSNWIEKNFNFADDIFDIQFTDPLKGWFTGEWGTLMHTIDGGQTWNPLPSSTFFDLKALSFPNTQKGWVVGDGGEIISITARYLLTVGKSGAGLGTVISNPAGIACGADCSESYTAGTPVTLTATAAVGSTFTGWSGACSGTGTCTVTMTAAKTVKATFTRPVLTVIRWGRGSGTVTSRPAGINCGSDCTEPYNLGSRIDLTATPAAGSAFVGWSGACAGPFPICFVAMRADRKVTATFSPARPIQTGD